MKEGFYTALLALIFSVSLFFAGRASYLGQETRDPELKENIGSRSEIQLHSTPSEPASRTAPLLTATDVAGSSGYHYEGLSEQQYTEDIWERLYIMWPHLADDTGKGLRDGIERMFLPYYSLTLSGYEAEEVFGGWELARFDESTEGYVSLGVYAYVREVDEAGDPLEGERGDFRWEAFGQPEIEAYYPRFQRHVALVSVENWDTLRIHLMINITTNRQGPSTHITYQLKHLNQRFERGNLISPAIEIKDGQKTQPTLGTLTYNEFVSTAGTEPGDRTLIVDAYWDLEGEDLETFSSRISMDRLFWAAWSYKDVEGVEDSINYGALNAADLRLCIEQAKCEHAGKHCIQISGDREEHTYECQDCGLIYGNEAHELDASTGCCSKCGYQLFVSGRVVYQLYDRMEYAEYSAVPGSSMELKKITGYMLPEKAEVPYEGGDIYITCDPIRYTIDHQTDRRELYYDQHLLLPREDLPGYEHEGYHYLSRAMS